MLNNERGVKIRLFITSKFDANFAVCLIEFFFEFLLNIKSVKTQFQNDLRTSCSLNGTFACGLNDSISQNSDLKLDSISFMIRVILTVTVKRVLSKYRFRSRYNVPYNVQIKEDFLSRVEKT